MYPPNPTSLDLSYASKIPHAAAFTILDDTDPGAKNLLLTVSLSQYVNVYTNVSKNLLIILGGFFHRHTEARHIPHL